VHHFGHRRAAARRRRHGLGAAFNISRTIADLIKSGAGACHLEDQVQAKRCGHRPGKALVSADEMADRIKAAVDGRTDDQFVIMARNRRARRRRPAGRDRPRPEVRRSRRRHDFRRKRSPPRRVRQFTSIVQVPVLANITEFGKTPLFTVQELAAQAPSWCCIPVGIPRNVEGGRDRLRRPAPGRHAEERD